jgi:hypothetical protein
MRGRSWLLIFVIGIGGFLAFGFLTKFALESNPEILRLGKLKAAIAEDCSSRGVENVALKALPGRRGYEIRVEASRSRGGDPEALASEIAECFIRKYGGPAPAFIKLTILEPGGFGCRGSQSYFVKEVRAVDLMGEMALRDSLKRFEGAVAARASFRMLPASPKEPLRVAVEIPQPRDPADLESAVEFLRAEARKHLAAGSGRAVAIEIRGGPGSPVLKEVKIEPFRGPPWHTGAFGRPAPAQAPDPRPSGPAGVAGR